MFKEQFYKDLEQGKRGEYIVAQYLQSQGYTIQDMSNDQAYYRKGDLLITLPTGEQRMVEVKNDTRIGDTGNILCEEEVYYKENAYYATGFMYNDYDIYAIVSENERKIYFFDFSQLKQIYKRYGEFRRFEHPTQYSDGYLLFWGFAKQFGALYGVVDY